MLSLFSAAVHGKFEDLVNAQAYQTQLDQHSTVIEHRRTLLLHVLYNLQHICFSGKDPTLYPGHFAYKWERELDHLHHIAKDNGFNFSFTTHNNNGI